MIKYENADAYIADRPAPIAALLTKLRAFIHKTLPGATEAMQYGVPVFLNAHKVPVVYLFGSSDHVNFGFLKFDQLSDPDAVLQGSGKPSKHIEVPLDQPIDTKTLTGFVVQCARITA